MDETRYFPTFITYIIFLFGLIGNAMVCLVVLKKRQTRTSFYMFLLSFAIADFIFCGWIFVNNFFYPIFDRLRVSSRILLDFHELSSIIALSTAMCLFSCQKNVNVKVSCIAIAIIWLFALSVPTTFYSLNADYRIYYSAEYSKLQFINLLPFIMVVVGLVQRFLLKFDKNPTANRLLLMLMVIYVLYWCPRSLIHNMEINTDHGPGSFFTNDPLFKDRLFMPYNLFIILYLVPKPILYCIMDTNFRNEFQDLISIWCKTKNEERSCGLELA